MGGVDRAPGMDAVVQVYTIGKAAMNTSIVE
jgi:hypothetical protein